MPADRSRAKQEIMIHVMNSVPGRTLGRYHLLESIGSGGGHRMKRLSILKRTLPRVASPLDRGI